MKNIFLSAIALLSVCPAFAGSIAATVPVVAEVPADTASRVSRTAPDGKYIYIPDSLQSDVIQLLKGHSKVVDDDSKLDISEKTIYKGDTIPMVLKSVNLGRYDRGLSNFLYIPKGMWSVGLTVSYGEIDVKQLDVFNLLSDITLGGSTFSIKPYLQYFFRNNMAVGLKFGYYNAKGNCDSFNVDIDGDMNFNISDIYYRAESYSAALTFTQYIGLTRRSRFGVLNEVELAFKTGNSDFRRPIGGEPKLTQTTTSEAQINFSPGVQVFIMKNVAFHVSFGVFGFSFKNEKQKVDGEPLGSRFSSGANFRFNLFNINFGIAVNL